MQDLAEPSRPTTRSCRQYLSPLTIVYLHALLHSALQHVVREDDLTRNVARNVQVSAGRRQRIEPLTAAEARHLLEVSRDSRLHALIMLALRTGMRRGELLGLRWTDADLTSGTLAIRQTLQVHPRRGRSRARPGPGPSTPNAASPCPAPVSTP
ncbi:tyrosine-type recombinase/integrase [Nonomuraea glycinis]|uniref:tyrosine-type recombinase/integrase n=1 Tax=Nonomuraea glycinis TaxID=2047744 RepID=UPI003899A090